MIFGFLVILLGIAVGLGIDRILTQRQRARQVVFDPPDLPEGFILRRSDHEPRRDSAEGILVLGPVHYEEAEVVPWESEAEFEAESDNPFGPESGGTPGGR